MTADRIPLVAAMAGVDTSVARELILETDWAAEGSATSEEFELWLEKISDVDLAAWLRAMARPD